MTLVVMQRSSADQLKLLIVADLRLIITDVKMQRHFKFAVFGTTRTILSAPSGTTWAINKGDKYGLGNAYHRRHS